MSLWDVDELLSRLSGVLYDGVSVGNGRGLLLILFFSGVTGHAGT